jgi:hypothetical protein
MTKITSVLIALSTLVSAAYAQTSSTINLTKGQKFVIENKFTATSAQEMGGQSIDTKADVFTSNNIEVKNLADKSYDLTTTYTKITAIFTAFSI